MSIKTFNVFGDDWDEKEDRAGFSHRETMVGQRVGGELIGATAYELDPGERSFPYHLHHANEEWLLVINGDGVLRTADGEQAVNAGDIACFRRGKDGAHQIINRSDAPLRYLMFSTKNPVEVVEYPDSDKVGVRSEGMRYLIGRTPKLDYWDGER